jgi:hypothetical protein
VWSAPTLHLRCRGQTGVQELWPSGLVALRTLRKDRPPSAFWPEGPVCEPCYSATLKRRGTCAGCATQRRLVWPPGAGATTCCDCAGIAPIDACATCGLEDKLYERGSCERCSLERRAHEVMAGSDGEVPSALRPLFDANRGVGMRTKGTQLAPHRRRLAPAAGTGQR